MALLAAGRSTSTTAGLTKTATGLHHPGSLLLRACCRSQKCLAGSRSRCSLRTEETRAQADKKGHGDPLQTPGKTNKAQQSTASHRHSDTEAQRRRHLKPRSSSADDSLGDTTLVLKRPVIPKGGNGVTKAFSNGKEQLSSGRAASIHGKDVTAAAEAAASPPTPILAPPPVAAGPNDEAASRPDPVECLPWLVEPAQRFQGLGTWRRLCARHRGGIRHDLVGRGLLSASAEKALLGDRILDLHLVLSMMNLEDPRVMSGEMMHSMSPAEASHRRGWILSNANMERHVEEILVPLLISKEELEAADCGSHGAGTMLEAAVGSVYLLEGRESEDFRAAVLEVLAALQRTGEDTVALFHCVQEVEAAGGDISSEPLLGSEGQWTGWGALGSLEVGPLGPFRSNRDARRAVAMELLVGSGSGRDVSGDPEASSDPEEQQEEQQGQHPPPLSLFGKPWKVGIQPKAVARRRKPPVGTFRSISSLGKQRQVILHLLPGETVDDWLLRKINKQPKRAFGCIQIAAASNESKILRAAYCWSALLRKPTQTTPNAPSAPALHCAVVHLQLGDGPDVVACGQGLSCTMAVQIAATAAFQQLVDRTPYWNCQAADNQKDELTPGSSSSSEGGRSLNGSQA